MQSTSDIDELPAGKLRHGWPWTTATTATATTTTAPDAAPPGDGSTAVWPRITVVIPSFNQGSYLEETIRSVILQAYPDLELLVMDGGSSDGSVEILERYDPWITFWTSERDGGQSDAVNRGFARATGELVTFFGSDDVYEPGTFHDVARLWRQHPGRGVVTGAFRFMDESSRRLPEVHAPRLPQGAPHDLTLLETSRWRIHQVSTFYSLRALDDVGRRVREDLHYTMDRELLYRVCRRFPAVLTDRLYASFRRHPASKSVAMILPMSREMADLHLDAAEAGEPGAVTRQRRRLWRERRSRGYEKLAASPVRRWRSAVALVQAAFYRPSLLTGRRYLKSWLATVGLLSLLQRLLRPASRGAAAWGGEP